MYTKLGMSKTCVIGTGFAASACSTYVHTYAAEQVKDKARAPDMFASGCLFIFSLLNACGLVIRHKKTQKER